MSSTNTTPNYKLPQFINSDVPSWLGDFNDAMSKIDTQMKANDTKATGASTNAENANSSATQALETANKANTTANGANTNATNALSLATTANDNASTAKQNSETALQTANSASGNASSALSMAQNANTNATKALNGLDKFNLNKQIQFNTSTGNIVNNQFAGNDFTKTYLTLATNSDGSIFKLYGSLEMHNFEAGAHTFEVKLLNTPLRPSEEISIQVAGLVKSGTNLEKTDLVTMRIQTNGDIILSGWANPSSGDNLRFFMLNQLYLLQAFDQATPTE